MSCFMTNILVFFFFLCVVVASDVSLYGITTEFIDNNRQTAVYTVQVDATTGGVTNLTQDFVYSGGSATLDGISAFNAKTGLYWFATDFVVPFLYSSDVYKKQLRPPLDVFAKTILRLCSDDNKGTVYSFIEGNNGAIQLISIGANDAVQIAGALPSDLNFAFIMAATVGSNGNIYATISTKRNTTSPDYKVFEIDPTTAKVSSQSGVIGKNCPGFPQYSAFANGKIYGVFQALEQGKLKYLSVEINPKTGDCSSNPLDTVVGIVTCATFSSKNNILYVHEATSRGGRLHLYSVLGHKEISNVYLEQGYIMESIEASTK